MDLSREAPKSQLYSQNYHIAPYSLPLIQNSYLSKLAKIQQALKSSEFFKRHEVNRGASVHQHVFSIEICSSHFTVVAKSFENDTNINFQSLLPQFV
jgi:hypothetical protein